MSETASPDTKSFWGQLDGDTPPAFVSYYPTRFEYFVGIALQGLITGRAEKDARKAVQKAIVIAAEMEAALDSAQN